MYALVNGQDKPEPDSLDLAMRTFLGYGKKVRAPNKRPTGANVFPPTHVYANKHSQTTDAFHAHTRMHECKFAQDPLTDARPHPVPHASPSIKDSYRTVRTTWSTHCTLLTHASPSCGPIPPFSQPAADHSAAAVAVPPVLH